MSLDIAALDTPAAQVEPAAILLEAAARTHSPSDRIGDCHAAWLITHPDAPVSTPETYPNWTPGGAS